MAIVGPADFWARYKAELQSRGSWPVYQSDPDWTKIAKGAAAAACEHFGLKTCTEYYNLDLLGYEETPNARHNWYSRVAYESENTPKWKDELCKLSYIAADLCVLASSQKQKRWRAEDALVEYLPHLADRIFMVPHRKWLFVFGPRRHEPHDRWVALTFDDSRQLVSVDEPPVLLGSDLKNLE